MRKLLINSSLTWLTNREGHIHRNINAYWAGSGSLWSLSTLDRIKQRSYLCVTLKAGILCSSLKIKVKWKWMYGDINSMATHLIKCWVVSVQLMLQNSHFATWVNFSQCIDCWLLCLQPVAACHDLLNFVLIFTWVLSFYVVFLVHSGDLALVLKYSKAATYSIHLTPLFIVPVTTLVHLL